MGVAELPRLRQLKEENKKIETLVTDLSLDKKMSQDVRSKNFKACCRRVGAAIVPEPTAAALLTRVLSLGRHR